MVFRFIAQRIMSLRPEVVIKVLILLQIFHRAGKRMVRLVIGNHHQERLVGARGLVEKINRPVADAVRPGEGFIDTVPL